MVTKILSRGGPACRYLAIRYLRALVLLLALPNGLLLGWLITPFTGALVKLANSERTRAANYLGVPAGPLLPAATPRQPGDVVTLFKDKSFKRSLWLLLTPLAMIPELLVVVIGLIGAPAAVAGMLLWKLDPGNFSLMGVGVDSWLEPSPTVPRRSWSVLSFSAGWRRRWPAGTLVPFAVFSPRAQPSWRRTG